MLKYYLILSNSLFTEAMI